MHGQLAKDGAEAAAVDGARVGARVGAEADAVVKAECKAVAEVAAARSEIDLFSLLFVLQINTLEFTCFGLICRSGESPVDW